MAHLGGEIFGLYRFFNIFLQISYFLTWRIWGLLKNTSILLTDLKRPAKVVDANPGTPRSYVVDSDGSTVRRNRRALRELSQSTSPHPQSACPQLEHTGVKMSRYGRTIKAIKRLDL